MTRKLATPSLVNPDDLRKLVTSSKHSIWLGALSFEERCIGSLVDLRRRGLRVTEGVALNYDTKVRPVANAESRRNINWSLMRNEGAGLIDGEIRRQALAAYGFPQLQELLEETVWRSKVDLVIFDITCLTKIHTLALAASIADSPRRVNWVVSYTIPENYSSFGYPIEGSPGWKDVIIAPLSETALLFNESHGRGILIPGHEADRLIVALAEIEPAGGLIAVADTKGRPDLRQLSERRNQKVVRQLTRMRSTSWTKHIVKVTDLGGMSRLVDTEIQLATAYDAPAILFPFGPKPLIFASALHLALNYPEASWFVYPMPSSYDAAYTEGIFETVWLAAQPTGG